MTNGDDKAFGDQTRSTRMVDGKTESYVMSDGLTKREYFAAMAMQGNLANNNGTYPDLPLLATKSVEFADALIDALNTTK